ncbi:DegT/DnrJ/EryC1/StrS family aminotransferase [Shouchella clausii]|uniref:Capsular biosynthesis protein n=1 Tax=Shouchella clausii TaxID=79880 RepID=A0A268P167_SHOCL|nr:DegT/DnrJ/EryC1/StrS family aminotransferase [Shouchella clausii]PAE89030.1 capsular biosynthesis protein [Shouchella clausii]
MTKLKRQIPFSPPDITDEDIREVIDTLKSGWITTGPKTKKFEERIAGYCMTNKAAALNSATACMEMTLRLLGIGEGDEVITSAYTYTASASVIDHVGAKIVLVDTKKGSYHLDYNAVERAITERTKAIIAVDIAGVICDYERLFQIVEAKRHLFKAKNSLQEAFNRVILIADAAHSFGATRNSKISGSIADFTCFSFHAVKNLTTGEGGAVTWKTLKGLDDKLLYQQYMNLSLHGQSKDALAKTKHGAWEYDIVSTAYKCNMTDIAASIGLRQLDRYDNSLEKRKQIINSYKKLLSNSKIEPLNHFNKFSNSSGHLFLCRVKGLEEKDRNEIIAEMAEKGIATNVHYKPLPMLTAYVKLGFKIEDFPNAYEMYRNEISLPLYTTLNESDVEYTANSLLEIVNKRDAR